MDHSLVHRPDIRAAQPTNRARGQSISDPMDDGDDIYADFESPVKPVCACARLGPTEPALQLS